MKRLSTVDTMTLDGGEACLDFVNSGYDREKDIVAERLHTYEDLLILAGRLNLFEQDTLDDLKGQALADRKNAERALHFARRVRELLYQLFTGLVRQSPERLNAGILSELNQFFAQALPYKVLVGGSREMRFCHRTESAGLMAPIWSFVLSAYELLEAGNLQLIRQCSRCAWVFIDKTKNHRKKWCSMESCGNGQKTKRYYQRKKAGQH